MGRPPKSIEEHKRDGTYRQDRHGSRSEIVIDGKPKRPLGMSADAKKHWDSFVPMLTARGVLTAADTNGLVMMCELWSEWQAAKRIKRKAGDIDQQAKRLRMIRSLATEWREHAGKYGLNPIDRRRIEGGEAPLPPLPPGDSEKKEGVAGFVGFRQQRKA